MLLACVGLAALLVAPGGVRAPLAPSAAAATTERAIRHPQMVVIDISSADEFDEALKTAGDSLVVVDYSTSWCGPCKIIAPKFDELSEKYTNVAFLKVRPLLAPLLALGSRGAHNPPPLLPQTGHGRQLP